MLIDGKKIAAELRQEIKLEISQLKNKYKKVPGLTVILVGDLPASQIYVCLLYTSPSPRDGNVSRMPSSA